MNIQNAKNRFSLAAKFNLATITLILVTSVGISLFMIRHEIENKYDDLVSNGRTIADMTAQNCEFGVFTEDRESLLRLIESLSVNPDIAYVSVLDRGNVPLVSKAFKGSEKIPEIPFTNIESAGRTMHQDFIAKYDGRPGRRYIEVLAPIVSIGISGVSDPFQSGDILTRKPRVIGHLRLGLSEESLRNHLRSLLASAFLVTSILILLGSGLTILLTKRIAAPLMKLKTATRDIAEGKLDSRIEIRTGDEISDLARSFDHMLEHLRSSRSQVEERTAELTATNERLLKEIAERKKAEEQLLHDAFHDALTGLPNRVLFLDRLAHAIAIAKRRRDYIFAVLFLDLDRFKVVNDSLGHLVGDQLLIGMGQRLGTCVRPGDTIARLGGDEFGILLEDIRGLSNATYIAERIQRDIAAPFTVAGHEVFATASIGIALNTAGYERPEQLLRDADTAMYQVKGGKKAGYVVFEPGMHEHAVKRLRLETDLRRGVERNEFIVYYQPILFLTTGRVIGYEALARWNHPERGLLGPGEFIQMAEETGIAVSIDRLVLREGCRQMSEWRKEFPDNTLKFISVNLSNKQMTQPDLVEYIAQTLKETDLDPDKLKLEITENVIIDNPEATAAVLSRLRALGVQLYIDDFGTGYSSLSYLHKLPINGLKIDRSFIERIGGHGEQQEIVRTILTLGRDLNIEVIAEGVETQEQLAQIKALQCEYWQGFLFSKPVDSEKAKALMTVALSGKDMPG